MRGSVFLALGLGLAAVPAAGQGAGEPARVLEVTLADLDEDAFDFLTGWERGNGDILDLAAEGYARFTLAALLAIEPGLPRGAAWGAGFAGGQFGTRSGVRFAGVTVPNRAAGGGRPSRRPRGTARGPRARPADGLAPLRTGRAAPPRSARPAPPRARGDSRSGSGLRPGSRPPRGFPAFGGRAPRGGSRGAPAGAPSGRAKPRGGSPARPRGAGNARRPR